MKTPLRYAFPDCPICDIRVVDEEDGGQHVEASSLLLQQLHQSYIDFGFNLTLQKVWSHGEILHNGSYTGILEMLRRNETDTSVPMVLGTASEIVNYDYATYTADVVIFSREDPSVSSEVDIITSLKCYSTSASLAILATIVFLLMIARKLSVVQNSFDFVSMMFLQSFPPVRNSFRWRLLFGLILGFTFFIVEMELASFSSDLTTTTKPDVVESVKDIVARNKTPFFIGILHLHESFRDGSDNDRKNAWRKLVQSGGEEENVFKINQPHKSAAMLDGLFKGSYAFILPKCAESSIIVYGCAFFEHQLKQVIGMKAKVHTSQPIETLSTSVPHSKGISRDLERKLLDMSQWLTESGIVMRMLEHMHEMFPMVDRNYECEYSYDEALSDVAEYSDLKVANFKIAFGVVSLLMMLAAIICVAEYYSAA